MDPLNYRSFYATCTDIFLRRVSVYWMIRPFELSGAGYDPGHLATLSSRQSRNVLMLIVIVNFPNFFMRKPLCPGPFEGLFRSLLRDFCS